VAEISDVFFVDGMRTPFGRAGEKGMYWNTRADDLAVKAIIGLMERNPDVPKDRIDDVAIAATSQTGDQGLTLGRSAAILAGWIRESPELTQQALDLLFAEPSPLIALDPRPERADEIIFPLTTLRTIITEGGTIPGEPGL